MKQVNYLTLKKKKQNWLGGHTSCLIDEGFRKQNCIMSAEEKKIMKDDIKKAKAVALKKKKQKSKQKNKEKNKESSKIFSPVARLLFSIYSYPSKDTPKSGAQKCVCGTLARGRSEW